MAWLPTETIPTLLTPRGSLAPFSVADAPRVQLFAGDARVARTTLNIPHPYPDGAAELWIATHLRQFQERRNVVLSIRSRTGELCGAINLKLELAAGVGELGYWIGVPFWGNGYCTEAARRLIQYGFEEIGLNKICARHFVGNTASGRVMAKAGMRLEAGEQIRFVKDGQPRESVEYAIRRCDH